MGEIPAGETVIVRSRPQCDPASGMNYYRVQYQNLNGWTSEGLGDEYWLEPIPGREFFLAETVDRLSTDALDEAIRLRHPDGVSVVITSENGERMATADLTGTIVVWNTLTGAEVAVMEHPGGVASMAFRPDGVVLVTGGSENNIRMWNILTVPTGEGTTIIRGGRVNGVAFNPLGRLLAGINPDGSVSVWDVTNSPAVLLVTLPSTGLLDTISFSADNTRLMAYGSQNVRIWSVQQ